MKKVNIPYGRLGMHILIDGYNLLKYIERTRSITKSDFIKLLAKYAELRNHLICIVFDGGDSPWPITKTVRKVTIIDAGWNQSADQYIQELVEQKKMSVQLLVSSDNLLGSRVMECGMPVIETPLFWNLALKALEYNSPDKKQVTQLVVAKPKEKWTDVDYAMQEATADGIIIKDDGVQKPDFFCTGKKSRLKRTVEEILKKL